MLEVQKGMDSLYRKLEGLNTPKRSFSGIPAKELRKSIVPDIDKPDRERSASDLLNSPITVIRGIGPVTQEKLRDTLGVITVADLAALNVQSRWTKIARHVQLLAEIERG